ncbi:peptidoglycan-associated lipoprotein Pal [Dongshaea marina]|uniref:peptidoglycan-associated lipoprotein Pal n=1 Tax=Dongshaea marina TaxID=2047966 RepID=UPI000D3E134F|nr:peptidoglycan-associated lipoprotein Pal [Dongshaea marina]
MRLKQCIKGIGIALPLLALAACSSTPGGDSAASGAAGSAGKDGSTVQTASADHMLTPQEKMAQQLQQLHKENTIYFKFDNSVITKQYVSLLQAHASYLLAHPSVKVVIEGNTDERGTPEYNIALGERRGNAVKAYLETLGVPAAQLSVVSYGEEKPADPGHTAAAYAKNRRAVLVY